MVTFRTAAAPAVARLLGAAGFLVAVALTLPAAAEPFHMKNHSPVWFGLLYPAAESPGTLAEGHSSARADFSYSSIFFKDNNVAADAGWNYFFDMELAQLTFDLRRGFGPFEAGVELPLFRAGGGFMDQTILDYHQAFGFPDYLGQREAPRNRYLYSVTHNGNAWNAASPNTATLGDVTVWLKRELVKDGAGNLAAKLLLQAPTASTSAGLGNGAWEYGLMLIGQRREGPLEVTINAAAVNPGFIDRGERITLKPMYLCDGAIELFITERLSAVGQLSYVTSPYGEEAAMMFQRAWYAITLGGRYVTDAGRKIEFSFLEDLSNTAPDFSIGFGVSF